MNKETIYIEQLLEKYFEGITSKEEEKFLRHYFRDNEVAEPLKMYKPMFEFFSQEIEAEKTELPKVRSNRRKMIQWVSMGVAACFILFFGLKFTLKTGDGTPSYSQVYIDGKKHTDLQTIQSEALNALENVSEGNEDILSSQIDLLESFSR